MVVIWTYFVGNLFTTFSFCLPPSSHKQTIVDHFASLDQIYLFFPALGSQKINIFVVTLPDIHSILNFEKLFALETTYLILTYV